MVQCDTWANLMFFMRMQVCLFSTKHNRKKNCKKKKKTAPHLIQMNADGAMKPFLVEEEYIEFDDYSLSRSNTVTDL